LSILIITIQIYPNKGHTFEGHSHIPRFGSHPCC